jgi:hypothetical protein
MVFDGATPLDMSLYPSRCVGKIQCGPGTADGVLQFIDKVGTGVLVGKNIVLTASHILPYNHGNGVVRFIPGFSNGSEPFGHFDTRSYTYLPAPSQIGGPPLGIDVGLVFLNQNPGDTLGWFGFQAFNSPDAYRGSFWATGYAAEKFDGAQAFKWRVTIEDVKLDVEGGGTDFELVASGYASAPFVGAPLWHQDENLLPFINGTISGNRDGRTVHAAGPLMDSFLARNQVTKAASRGS